METKELRIGNYVNFETGEKGNREYNFETQIEDATGILYIENGNFNVKPIPLTEEWLFKFGFNNDGKDYFINATRSEFRPIKIRMIFGNEGLYCAIWDEEQETVLFEEEKYYVHQLQNLYFALTGEELTLKTKKHEN